MEDGKALVDVPMHAHPDPHVMGSIATARDLQLFAVGGDSIVPINGALEVLAERLLMAMADERDDG